MDLPTWIDEEVWQEFIAYRCEMKKPLSERAQRMTLKRLEGFLRRGFDPNESLMNSIVNGWQGVFECEVKSSEKGQRNSGNVSAVERVRRANAAALGENGSAFLDGHGGNVRPQMADDGWRDADANVVVGAFRVIR